MFGATTADFVKERNHAVSLAFRKPQELRFRRYNDPKSRLCNNGMDTVPHLEKVSHDITPNELNGIPKENFASCLSTLGAHRGWSEAQKNTLLIRVNADINEICKLSPQEVMSSQHILTAVTKSHLRCIDLNDLDILTTLGNPSMNWTSEKLVHLADRYKVLNPYFKLSNSSTEAIVSLGLVLCGFMEYEIESIDPAVYRKVSVIVGTYTACPVQKVKALLDLATRTAAYGPVAKWTCSTISDVGILMAMVID
ncbi:putative stereocilin-like protein [Lineus longissimus]|uniref:putative stereocilin-like protein n=1 Tax=Lineus longissimus TaxID=88925 RepID=UPI00315DF1AC